jgi:FMN phosphatase YigB (HAD superfamily)
MALSLRQYADFLNDRDLAWPAPPEIQRPKAKPHLVPLPHIKAITWSVYGTLLAIQGGEICFEHPSEFMMDTALDKTIQEFKMWPAMSRKPGQPSDQLRQVYANLLLEQKMQPTGGERHPEVLSERLWAAFIKRLMQNDYVFDSGFYGALNEFSRKIAYFFHASIQGTRAYPQAASTLMAVINRGFVQGLLTNSQCFTLVQLERALEEQNPAARLDDLMDAEIRALSNEARSRKPSERLFRHGIQALAKRGISPEETIHVGSRVSLDVVPARRLGMKTALFIGDAETLKAAKEELKSSNQRPDVMLTELEQLLEVLPG